MTDSLLEVDQGLFRFINGLSGRNDLLDRIFSLAASDYLIPVSIGLILVYIWLTSNKFSDTKRGKNNVVLCVFTMFIASAVVFICNAFYFRERPFTVSEVNLLFYMPTDSSFPSNTAAGMMGLSMPILFERKSLFILALLGCILICFARIYVGIHYPSDVLVGFLIALGSLVLCIKLVPLTQPFIDRIINLAERLNLT